MTYLSLLWNWQFTTAANRYVYGMEDGSYCYVSATKSRDVYLIEAFNAISRNEEKFASLRRIPTRFKDYCTNRHNEPRKLREEEAKDFLECLFTPECLETLQLQLELAQ